MDHFPHYASAEMLQQFYEPIYGKIVFCGDPVRILLPNHDFSFEFTCFSSNSLAKPASTLLVLSTTT